MVVFGGAAFLGSILWCIPYRWSSLPHTFLIQQTTLLAAAVTASMTMISSPYGYMLTSAMLGLALGGLDVFTARQLSRLFIQEEAVSVASWTSFFRGVGSLLGVPLIGLYLPLTSQIAIKRTVGITYQWSLSIFITCNFIARKQPTTHLTEKSSPPALAWFYLNPTLEKKSDISKDNTTPLQK